MDRDTGPFLFLALLLMALVLLIVILWAYLSAIVLGMLLASVSMPLNNLLKRLFGRRQAAAPAILTVLLFLTLILPVGWFVETVSREAFDLYERTRDVVSYSELKAFLDGDSLWAIRIRTVSKALGIRLDNEMLNQLAGFLGKDVGLFLYKQLSAVASNFLSFIVHFFLMMATIYFLLKDGQRLKEYLLDLLPIPAPQVEKVAGKFHEVAKALILINGLSGLAQGVLAGFGFFLFGMPSPFLWGTVTAVMAFLPVLGASVVFIPAGLILLIQGYPGHAAGYLAYNIAYAFVIEYIFKPRFIGKGMSMSPFLVFLGILGGLKVFGIMGIVYGPLIITVFLTMAEIYRIEYKSAVRPEISQPI